MIEVYYSMTDPTQETPPQVFVSRTGHLCLGHPIVIARGLTKSSGFILYAAEPKDMLGYAIEWSDTEDVQMFNMKAIKRHFKYLGDL